jgi:hypothetical protein
MQILNDEFVGQESLIDYLDDLIVTFFQPDSSVMFIIYYFVLHYPL